MLTLFAALLAASHVSVDPLKEIRAGKIRCAIPNLKHKTCITMARYLPRVGGGFDVAVVGLTTDSGIAIHYQVPLVVRDGGLCLTLNADDIAKASFSKAGVPLTGQALAAVREQERAFLTPLLGHQVCSLDTVDGDLIVARGYADGERFPALDKSIIWIDAKDGYTIGPMPGDAI